MDTKIKILIFCFLSAFSLYGQTPNINFAAKFQITSATGGDPYNIIGIVSDDLSRFTGSDVQINDSIYVIDGDQLYVLAVTSITTVVGPTVTLVANDPNNAGVSIPTGQAAICRPTNNYNLPTYISGLRDDLRSMVMNRQAQLIDNIVGGGVGSITDFVSAGENVPPSPLASDNDGETWRNMTTGELWRSDGFRWYSFTYSGKECQDTVLVSAITVQSGGLVSTGSPLVRNSSGVWEHMYNHPSGLNLIPDGVITDVITGPRAIIQYCGVRKGSGATPNTSYYVNQSTNTGFTTTKPSTNIRPLGKVASNGDFLINAGLLFSKDNYPNLVTSVELSGTGQGTDSIQLAQQNAQIGNALLWDGTSTWKPFAISSTVKEYAVRNKVSPASAFNSLLSFYSTRSGKIVVDTTVNISSNLTVSTGINIEMVKGGLFTVANTATLTINGIFNAQPSQNCFTWTGTGTVVFGKESVDIVWPYWFGAKNDGTTDCYAGLQKTVNVTIASQLKNIKLLGGQHNLSQGVVIKKPSSFVYINISGSKSYDGSWGTLIQMTSNTSFAFGIQGARAVKISDILFHGLGTSYDPTLTEIIENTNSEYATQWGRNDRYSPFSAIVIDPFSDTAPTGGGYPGYSSEYSAGNVLSASIIIEEIIARYFIVGICISPTATTGNGSEIIISKSQIFKCQYGIVTCQTQSRSIDVNECSLSQVQTCMDGLTFGNQSGPMPNCTNTQFAFCKQMLRFNNGYGDGKIVNTYGESIWSIGYWQGNFGTLTMMNCEIKLATEDETLTSSPASIFDSGSKLTMVGGFIGYSNYRAVEMACKAVEFIGVSLKRLVVNTPDGSTASNQITYENCRIDGYLGANQNDLFSAYIHVPEISSIEGSFGLPNYKLTYNETESSNVVEVEDLQERQQYITFIDTDTIAVNHTTHKATWTTRWPGKYRVGDILTAYNNNSDLTPSGSSKATTFGVVESVVGNIITTKDIPGNIVGGIYGIYLYEARRIIPTHIGNITNNSNKVVITSKSTTGTLSSYFPAGTRIYTAIDPAINTGLLPGLYVTSITADTLFLSGNCLSTTTGLEIFGATGRTTYYSQDNTYQTSGSTHRNVGYRTGDKIKFKSHPYRSEAIVTSGGFTPTVKFAYKSISGTTGSRPTPESVDNGLQYFNTTTNALEVWNGTTWVPAIVSSGTDSTLVKTNGSYANKRITDNIYKNGTLGIRTTDTTGVFNLSATVTKPLLNFNSNNSWLFNSPKDTRANSGLIQQFELQKSFNDSASVSGDNQVFYMGFNPNLRDATKAGMWLAMENSFNNPGNFRAYELHLPQISYPGSITRRPISGYFSNDASIISGNISFDADYFVLNSYKEGPNVPKITIGIGDQGPYQPHTQGITFQDTAWVKFAKNNVLGIYQRNAANTADIRAMFVNSLNQVDIGNNATATKTYEHLIVDGTGLISNGIPNGQLRLGDATYGTSVVIYASSSNQNVLSFRRVGQADRWNAVMNSNRWILGPDATGANVLDLHYQAPYNSLTVGSTGKVGFGTISPVGKIHATTTSGVTQQMISVENTSGTSSIFRSNATPESVITANQGDLALVNDGEGKLFIKKTGTGNTGWEEAITPSTLSTSAWKLNGNSVTAGVDFIGSTNNTSMRFRTNNTQRMIIDSTGKVGIGTNTPATRLHISGSGTPFRFNNAANDGFNVNQLDVNSWAWTGLSGGMFFHLENSDFILPPGQGNIGIGTAYGTTPTEKLQVAGNIRFSGALMPNNTAGTSGQVLTSAGAGTVPTWTTNTSESTTIGAFQTSGNSTGLTLSGTDIRLHAATISTPGAVNVGQQTFSSGADTKIFTGTGSRQLTVDGDTDNTAAGISFTQLGGTDEIAYISANSSDASNGAMRILLEEGAALTEYINIGTANDTKGIFERGGLYETVTTVTTTPYTIAYGDRNVYLNGTSITVNLQGIGGSAGQTKIGRVIYLFNDNATSVTITPNGSDTINDAASLTLSANTGVTLLAVATNIWVTRD